MDEPKATISRGELIIKKVVPLSVINEDPELQLRVAISQEKIDEYVAYIEEHGSMDAMDTFIDSLEVDASSSKAVAAAGGLLLSDGAHRLAAYRKAGKDRAPVYIRYGNKSDALQYAIRKNCKHGLGVTNADKRRAATLAVTDKQTGELADATIAKMIGVSASLVASARSGFKPEKKKPVESRREEVSDPPAGPREVESPAPKSATTRERSDPKSQRPTRDNFLKEIESHVNHDVADERDVVALFETKDGAYAFMPKVGGTVSLKIVGGNGRKIIEVPVVVKDLKLDGIILKFEGPGKITMTEEGK